MDFITVKEAAEKWGVTTRQVQSLCSQQKIKGAYRFGRSWMIPSRAILPSSSKKGEAPHLPMPRRSPFLDMTNIYNEAGRADECAEMLLNNPEAYTLYKAQIAYRRGEIDKVYDHARYFLNSHSGFYAIVGGGMLLALCAIWRGDINLWNEAKKHICSAPHESEHEREIISLALAIIDSSIYDNKDYPDWFVKGNFEVLPPDSHPAAKVFYIKYIYMTAFAIASGQLDMKGLQGLALMRIIPNIIEPLITQAVVDKTVIPEIYLRLSCAVAYHNAGDDKSAINYIDKAIALALPDKLYGLLAEYVRHFDGILQERIALVDREALEDTLRLYEIYRIGWSRISGIMRNKYIATNLTPKEHEIAKLSVFGFSVHEIASLLYVSDSTVKQAIARVINKTGIQDKREFYTIL